MSDVYYVVDYKGRLDMTPDERKAIREKIEAVEGKEVWDTLRYQSRRKASERAHWMQSTIGVRMEVKECYPVKMKVF